MLQLRLLLIADCDLPQYQTALRENANFEVLQVCRDWAEVEAELNPLDPDVVIVFVNPAAAAQQLAGRIAKQLAGFRCVLVASADQMAQLHEQLRSSPTHRLVPSTAPLRDLCNAICDVADDGLSDRERDVLRMIARGYTNKEIAGRLELSVKSVEKYKTRSYEKLGLRSRASTVTYAISRGWLVE